MRSKTGRENGRAQSAFELISVYGIAILILAVVITFLYILFPATSLTINHSCSFSGGVTCSDIVLNTQAFSGNSVLVVLLNNAGTTAISSPAMLARISGVNSSASAKPCMPKNVEAGGSILCVVNLTGKYGVNHAVTGTLYFSEQNCALEVSGGCAQEANQIYAGSFGTTSQYGSSNLGLGISLTAATNSPLANNEKDQLTATVSLKGAPLKGVTVNFTETNAIYLLAPKYTNTNSSGVALSYVSGSKPGSVTVHANFSNSVSAYVKITIGTTTSTTTICYGYGCGSYG